MAVRPNGIPDSLPRRPAVHCNLQRFNAKEETMEFSAIADQLGQQAIELPSWAFGHSGTRFRVFSTPGTPRDPYEKVADAAQVHKYTGLAPTVALHIPWDTVDSYADLARFAADHGVALGTINSNTFQDEAYKFGSLTSH